MENFNERCINDIYRKIFIHCSVDPNDILSLFKSSNTCVRAATIGNIFRFADEIKYIDEIIPYLDDEKNVAIQAIYMTHKSLDRRLIPIYINLLDRFEKNNVEGTERARFHLNKFLELHG